MNNNKNKSLIVIIVILAIALFGTIGYIVTNKNSSTTKNEETIKNNPVQNESKENKVSKEFMINFGEKLIKKYNYGLCGKSNPLIIKNSLTKYNDIKATDKLIIVLTPFYEEFFLGFLNNYDYGKVTIPKYFYENEYKKLWGPNSEPNYQEYDDPYSDIEINQDNIQITAPGGYGCGPEPISYTMAKVDNVELKNNELLIQVKYLYFDVDEYDEEKANNLIVKIYNDVEKSNLIAEEKTSVDNYIQEKSDKTLENKYLGKAGQYNLTFKKDKDRNYYWYSTEYDK